MTAPHGTALDGDPVRLVQELALLETEYWYDVDHNWGRSAHELYLDDGLFAIGKTEMSGRDAIREFYRWREQPRGAHRQARGHEFSRPPHRRRACVIRVHPHAVRRRRRTGPANRGQPS